MNIEQYQRYGYTISTDLERLDRRAIYAFLRDAYWAESIPVEVVERSLRGSPHHRGQGSGRWLMECVLSSSQLHGLRRWMLMTRHAHRLYRQLGFASLANPDRVMEIDRSGMYRSKAEA